MSAFAQLEAKFAQRPGVTNPTGLAAAIGRKKYGAAGMAAKASAGRKNIALAAAGGKPDVTYNPNPKTTIPYSTHSATAARSIAANGGQKSNFNHR